GNLYIADEGNNRGRKVSPAGNITTVAGNDFQGYFGDGGPATSARLNNPSGLIVDTGGNVYVADAGNSRIRKVSPSGIIATVAGNGSPGYSGDGGPATSAQLSFPSGVAVDASGNLYVADYNQRIRKVSRLGSSPRLLAPVHLACSVTAVRRPAHSSATRMVWPLTPVEMFTSPTWVVPAFAKFRPQESLLRLPVMVLVATPATVVRRSARSSINRLVLLWTQAETSTSPTYIIIAFAKFRP